MTAGKNAILATILYALAGCGGSLSRVGNEPTFTPIGHSQGLYRGVDPSHSAVAVAAPTLRRPDYSEGSLWHSGPTSLFGDRRARHLGDIMTVVIDISDEASISNSSQRSRSGSDDLSVPNFLGLETLAPKYLPGGAGLSPAVGLSSSSAAQGTGTVARNEDLSLRVAATVVDVLDNGHLVVRGNQEVRVNFELRDLQVAGIVRPEDISRRNEITYDKIAGARISYGGRGQISDMQQPRFGQQIVDQVLPY